MSIYDEIGVAMIPSGYKEEKLYSVLPNDGDGDFDFSRGTSGTRVNSAGLIETAQALSTTELVTNGDFSTNSNWALTDSVIEDGVLKLNGTTNSYLRARQNINFTGLAQITYTISFNNTSRTTIQSREYGGANHINIPATVGTHTVNRTFNTTGVSFQTGQMSQGEAIHIDNVSVKEISENNVPRLDYPIVNGAVRDCPALLLEPQRTNLVTYSEYFSDSSWTKVNASISSNTTTSPSGATNASTLVSTSGTSEQYLDVGSLSVTSGEDYTMSVFVKKNNYDFFLIRFTGVGGAFSVGNVFFNINNGTLGTVDSGYTGSIKSFGNGWYRCSATKTASGTTASGKVRLQLATSDNTESITGDGSSGTFIYGSQFEQSSYPTSYIPTNGSSVTRNAEVCNNSGTSGDFNSTEGVLFAEIAALSDDIQQQIGVYGSSTEQLRIEITNNVIKGQLYNGAFQANMSSTQTVTNFNKVALKWKVDDFALWINGTEVATDSSGTTFSAETLDRLHFSAQNGSTYAAQAKTKQLMVFKKALTDAELETLTTL
jgi:hypothetical protein